ncbi:hypothetical protein GQ53DRAFT_265227 [Thozetella sp. PMI_491]|nr:hypothetical protein GQ53DRAFT_265227 [Thozetella sp. PMI_491]
MSLQTQKPRLTDLDWARHEAKITKLYWEEDRTRGDVMDIMAREENFHASKSQYETRFKKWRITKYHKSKHWSLIGHRLGQRRDFGKQSEVLFDGRVVPNAMVQRETRRHYAPSHFQGQGIMTTFIF